MNGCMLTLNKKMNSMAKKYNKLILKFYHGRLVYVWDFHYRLDNIFFTSITFLESQSTSLAEVTEASNFV